MDMLPASVDAVSDQHFRLLVEAVEDYAIYMLDPLGHITTWNLGAERNKGYRTGEIVGRHFSCFFTPVDQAAGFPARSLRRAEEDGHYAAEGWRVRKDGRLFWASVVINAMRDDRGALIGFAKVTRDLTERRAGEETLRNSERALQREKDRLQIVIQAIGDGVISTDADGRITMMNPGAEVIAGCTFAMADGRTIEDVLQIVDGDGISTANPLRRCLVERTVVQQQDSSTLLLPSGVKRDVHTFAAPIQTDGRVVGAVLTLQDVTAMRVAQREIEFNSLHDPLTRLANRRNLESKVQSAIEDCKRKGTQSVLCILDLDRFKIVNDTAGHIAGDALLRTISSLMLRHVHHRDMVARLGGDEFALVLEDCSVLEAQARLRGLLEKIAAHEFFWEEHLFHVSGSLGAASVQPNHDLISLFKEADGACYAAKHGGRNRLEFAQASS